MRDHHTRQTLNAWLDTPGGLLMAAQHGSREGAAVALAAAEAQDRAWRRWVAEEKFERYPGRYPSVADAMADVPDPKGGSGAWLEGSADEIVSAVRRIDPASGIKNLGGDMPDGAVTGAVQPPGRDLEIADVRPPWRREG
jgi:hypothetical protein